MSRIALDHLREQLPDNTGDKSEPWAWYLRVRKGHPELLAPYLVEPSRENMSPNYYVLKADPQNPSVAILEQQEFKPDQDEARLPWFQLPGNMSGDAGPLVKRSTSPGPTPNVTKQTLTRLRSQAESSSPWSDYFFQAAETLERRQLRFKEETLDLGLSALDAAIKIIPEDKVTCFLAFADEHGQLPGDRKDYASYLQAMLPTYKYVTKDGPPVQAKPCALCSTVDAVYPSALRGTGLNLTNLDRIGVFSGLEKDSAWKKFALCAACADLLYIYSHHLQSAFTARVAGARALLVPYTDPRDPDERLRFVKRVRDRYMDEVNKGESVIREEKRLQDLAEEDAVTSITILWADFGQKLDNVRGMVTDILPSRLRAISGVVRAVNEDRGTPFPELEYEGQLRLDVAFNYLGQLLKRPGGKRTEKTNKGPRLFDLKRDMAAAVYHGRRVPEERLLEEVREISEAYLLDALEHGYGLFNEGWNSKKGVAFLTIAGWVRHLCRFLYFLRKLEVYPQMEEWRYQPRTGRLREFFDDSDGRTGIDSQEKAYAFLLGALFGKLMQVQAARGVNVGANALPWLKRFTLTGKDLPDLYVKIREKLMTYRAESSDVREVIEELGNLGTTLGTKIDLSQTETGYFLLLGQSLSLTFMPSKGKQTSDQDDGEETR